MKILKKIIIITIITFIIILIIFVSNKKVSNKKENDYSNENNVEVMKEKKLEKVKSATAFFTAQSCANKYLTYISQSESDEVYKLLEQEYINNNKITQNNVLEILNKDKAINGMVSLEAEEMYVEEIDENNNKYYIRGILKKEEFDEEEQVINSNFKIAITLDFDNMIFSVNPLVDGGIFDEKDN